MAPSKSDTSYSDRQPFFGSRGLNSFKKQASAVDRGTFQKVTRLAVSALEGKSVQHQQLSNLASSQKCQLDIINVIYVGVLKILQSAFRCSATSLSKEQFFEDLQLLPLQRDFCDDLASVVFGSRRSVLDSARAEQRPRLPTISDLKWRVDVGISTASLNRVLEPVVFLQMTLNNGETVQFEMTVSKFQELRYNVATVLQEIGELEKRSILKIKD